MAIRPVYSKLVLPSRKSLEIIINIKIIIQKIDFFFNTKNGGCPLIRACLLIRSNTVTNGSADLRFIIVVGNARSQLHSLEWPFVDVY